MKPNGKAHTFTDSEASEQSLLGTIMLWPDLFAQVSARLTASDFSRDSHRRIFGLMSSRSATGKPIDRVSLGESLRQSGELQSLGGWEYLEKISDFNFAFKHGVPGFIEEILKSARLRNLSLAIERSSSQAAHYEEPDAIIGELEQDLIENMQHGSENRTEPLEVSAQKAFEELIAIKRSERECVGLTSGLPDIDRETTGFREGEYTVIGARPGQGKSWLMCQSARANCKAGVKVGIFSIEMRRRQLLHRFACQESGVSFDRIRDPHYLNVTDEQRLAESYADISRWPLVIDDTPVNRDQLAARARLMIRQGVQLIFVDYIQRIQKDQGEKLFDAVTAHSLCLAELAHSTGKHIVALSQLKRIGGEEPTLEDFRQSGQIEQDVDMAWLIHRPKEDSQWTHKDKIIIAKNRSGVDGQYIRAYFDGEHGLFRPGEWR